MFPKKIHQTWVDFNNRGSLSSNENRWIDTWKQKNPSYEYKLWTKQENDDLVANHYSDYKDSYDNYDREIKRVEFAKACYLHKYGGIYADVDFECLKSFDALLDEHSDCEVILGRMWTDDSDDAPECTKQISSLDTSIAISKPGSDFWLHYMNAMSSRTNQDYTKEYATGAIALNDSYASFFGKEKIIILPKENFFPLSWVSVLRGDSNTRDIRNKERSGGGLTNQEKQDNFSNAYAVTYWNESWKSESKGDSFLPE